MSEQGKNINSRFSDFEPETDDSSIEKSWERIKYFLPQEKKRRGFMYWKFPGSKLVVTGAFFIGALAALYFYENPVIEENKAQKDEDIAAKSKTTLKTEKPLAQHSKSKIVKNETNRNPLIIREPNGAEPTAIDPAEEEKNMPRVLPSHQDVENEETNLASADIKESEGVAGKKEFAPVETPAAGTDTLLYDKLDPISLMLPERNDSINIFLPELHVAGKPGHKGFMLEVIAGDCHASTGIKAGADKKQFRGNALSIGLGAIYRLKGRWNINALLVYSGNKFAYKEEKSGNVVTLKDFDIGSSVMVTPDTNIHYLQVRSEKTLSSGFNCIINGGLGYSLFEKNKFSVDVSLPLSMKYSVYTFGIRNIHSEDTLVYKRTKLSPPLENEIVVDPEMKKRFSVFTFGITPGLTFNYKLTARLAFIFKPSYYYPFSKTQLKTERENFTLKQDNLFLNVGLRIRL